MKAGYLALVLHAHLPFVRHPEFQDSLEEHWFFEAVSDTYLPLLSIFEAAVDDGIDFRLALSISPPLATMLTDRLLISRYLNRLDRMVELGEREIERTKGRPELNALAYRYHRRYVNARRGFLNRYDCNLIEAFKRLQDSGRLEILATCATHGYLPLLSVNPSAVRAQIRTGVDLYRRLFGADPKGFWLPECGYYPGVDRFLRDEGIRYTILETHGLTRATPRPNEGVYAPVHCPSGVAAFGRDPDCSRQVWSSMEGYPGDPDYREFYRDIGYDLDMDVIGPYIHRDGIRIDTGYKYFRITGRGPRKEVYRPERAMRRAEAHAEDFLFSRVEQIGRVSERASHEPIIVAPYDAELFGHWWFEGPIWLDFLIRKIAWSKGSLRLVTPSEYLENYPEGPVATPSTSSWGRNGYHETWLNERNGWIYPHLHSCARIMERLVSEFPDPDGHTLAALKQAGRELLLAQSSDWAFMMDQGDTADYAVWRTKTHLLRFNRIAQQIEAEAVDRDWVSRVAELDNIFPDLDYRVFSREQTQPHPHQEK